MWTLFDKWYNDIVKILINHFNGIDWLPDLRPLQVGGGGRLMDQNM